MKKSYRTQSDEIDLIHLLQVVWEGKPKVIAVTIILFLAAYGYQSFLVPKNFIATTEIKPVESSEMNEYITLNAYLKNVIQNIDKTQINGDTEFNEKTIGKFKDINNGSSVGLYYITQSSLLDRYLEVLEYRSVFEEAIRKFNLIDIDNYANEKEYDEAAIMFASSIQILPAKKNNIGEEISYGSIQFVYDDKNKWTQVLNYVNEITNKIVQRDLKKMYEKLLSVLRDQKLNQIEDLTIEIENFIDDYDRETNDKLLFLQEQAEIARTLGVPKNTLETHVFIAQNTMLTSVETKTPLYLRGYEAIEKEINLIKSRDEEAIKAFVPGLYKLEQKKRKLLQDKTLIRANSILEKSSLSDINFKAALINVSSTNYGTLKNNRLIYLSIIFGLIIGIFYTLISDAFRVRNELKKD